MATIITSSVVEAAVELGRSRTPCFPCREDKAPAISSGFRGASADERIIRAMWTRHPGPLVGIPTGAASLIDVLDIDPKNGGDKWLDANSAHLPRTLSWRTRSAGRHFIFRHDPQIRCSAGRIAPGIDVRGDGGYVIFWPAAGLPLVEDAPIARWPFWLRDLALRRPASTPKVVARVPDNRSIRAILAVVRKAPPGTRNSAAFWAACRLGEMAKTGLISMVEAEALVADAAMDAGLPEREARDTAASGVRTGARA